MNNKDVLKELARLKQFAKQHPDSFSPVEAGVDLSKYAQISIMPESPSVKDWRNFSHEVRIVLGLHTMTLREIETKHNNFVNDVNQFCEELVMLIEATQSGITEDEPVGPEEAARIEEESAKALADKMAREVEAGRKRNERVEELVNVGKKKAAKNDGAPY